MFLFLSAMMRVDLEYIRHVVSGNIPEFCVDLFQAILTNNR